jgi:hypothetical protein
LPQPPSDDLAAASLGQRSAASPWSRSPEFVPESSAKASVQVVAASAAHADLLRSMGHNPCVEILLGPRKTVWDIVFHLYGKWGRALSLHHSDAGALPSDLTVHSLLAAFAGSRKTGSLRLTYTLLDTRIDMLPFTSKTRASPASRDLALRMRTCAQPVAHAHPSRAFSPNRGPRSAHSPVACSRAEGPSVDSECLTRFAVERYCVTDHPPNTVMDASPDHKFAGGDAAFEEDAPVTTDHSGICGGVKVALTELPPFSNSLLACIESHSRGVTSDLRDYSLPSVPATGTFYASNDNAMDGFHADEQDYMSAGHSASGSSCAPQEQSRPPPFSGGADSLDRMNSGCLSLSRILADFAN